MHPLWTRCKISHGLSRTTTEKLEHTQIATQQSNHGHMRQFSFHHSAKVAVAAPKGDASFLELLYNETPVASTYALASFSLTRNTCICSLVDTDVSKSRRKSCHLSLLRQDMRSGQNIERRGNKCCCDFHFDL